MANIRYDDYCGIPYAAVGQSAPGESVVLTTSDVFVASGNVIEFLIAIGCGADVGAESVYPVYLHYSVDYGVTWHLVMEECLPFEPGCHGEAQTASIYYPTGRWRRVTVPLPSATTSPYVPHLFVSCFQGCGLGLDVSYQRLGLVSRKIVNVSSRSWSREADFSVSSQSQPFTSRAQDQFSAKLCRPH